MKAQEYACFRVNVPFSAYFTPHYIIIVKGILYLFKVPQLSFADLRYVGVVACSQTEPPLSKQHEDTQSQDKRLALVPFHSEIHSEPRLKPRFYSLYTMGAGMETSVPDKPPNIYHISIDLNGTLVASNSLCQ